MCILHTLGRCYPPSIGGPINTSCIAWSSNRRGIASKDHTFLPMMALCDWSASLCHLFILHRLTLRLGSSVSPLQWAARLSSRKTWLFGMYTPGLGSSGRRAEEPPPSGTRLLQALLTTLVLIPWDLAGGAMKEKLLTRMERWDTKALWACAAFPP